MGDQLTMSAQNGSPHSLFSGHLLVAEDNPVNIMVIESLLKKLGTIMTLAKNGQEVVDAITHQDRCITGEDPDGVGLMVWVQ